MKNHVFCNKKSEIEVQNHILSSFSEAFTELGGAMPLSGIFIRLSFYYKL